MIVLRIMVMIIGIFACVTTALAVNTMMNDDCQLIFNDVPSYSPFCRFIEKFAELGITAGYEDGTFRPTETVTRAQMAVFVLRALELLSVPSEHYKLILILDPTDPTKMFLPAGLVNETYSQIVTMQSVDIVTPEYICSASGVSGITASTPQGGNVCTIIGTPTETGMVIVKFTVRDLDNPLHIDQRLRTIAINNPAPLSLSIYPEPAADPLDAGTKNVWYKQERTMAGLGGTAPYFYSCIGFGVSGITASTPQGGNVCTISGTPTGTGVFTVTMTVTDGDNASAWQDLSFSVDSGIQYTDISPVYDGVYYIKIKRDIQIGPKPAQHFYRSIIPPQCQSGLWFSVAAGSINVNLLISDSDFGTQAEALSLYQNFLAESGQDTGFHQVVIGDKTYWYNFRGSPESEGVDLSSVPHPNYFYMEVVNESSQSNTYTIEVDCW